MASGAIAAVDIISTPNRIARPSTAMDETLRGGSDQVLFLMISNIVGLRH